MLKDDTIERYKRMGLATDLRDTLEGVSEQADQLYESVRHEHPINVDDQLLWIAAFLGRAQLRLLELAQLVPEPPPGFADELANALRRGDRFDHGGEPLSEPLTF